MSELELRQTTIDAEIAHAPRRRRAGPLACRVRARSSPARSCCSCSPRPSSRVSLETQDPQPDLAERGVRVAVARALVRHRRVGARRLQPRRRTARARRCSSASTATFIGLALGLVLGVLAGFGGRVVDYGVNRLVEVLFAFPGLLLALLVIVVYGPGPGDRHDRRRPLDRAGLRAHHPRPVRGRSDRRSTSRRPACSGTRAGASSRATCCRTRSSRSSCSRRSASARRSCGPRRSATSASALSRPRREWGAMLAAGRTYLSTRMVDDGLPRAHDRRHDDRDDRPRPRTRTSRKGRRMTDSPTRAAARGRRPACRVRRHRGACTASSFSDRAGRVRRDRRRVGVGQVA